MALYTTEFGEEHLETIRVMTNIGGVYRSLGRLGDALDVYQKCLVLMIREYCDFVGVLILIRM